eukprot:scaffold38779_cov49-Attheya_sp.AAC.1
MGQCQSSFDGCTTSTSAALIRTRYSVRELEALYDSGENPKLLEDLMTAWKRIKEIKATELKSFFTIAGYHGEPFVGPGAIDGDEWWGGYCNHRNVLFPTWHRAYLIKLEEALQSAVPGVSLAYWDETSPETKEKGIPHSLTDEVFYYKTPGQPVNPIPNPLRSYTFQKALDDADNGNKTYKKNVGYETKRYPLSGLQGTDDAILESEKHNAQFLTAEKQVTLLNQNVKLWINGSDDVRTKDGKATLVMSIATQFTESLSAPNYTLFSNVTSSKAFNAKNNPHVTPLESAHNSIHLAVGGFDSNSFQIQQDENSEAGYIKGSNGDMGENNTAAFDPIFHFHHCNVDRMFWVWQKKHGFKSDFDIISGDPGANSDPIANFPKDVPLTLDTPLSPFMVDEVNEQRMYTSKDLINIETQLGYTYSDGSLDSDYTLPKKSRGRNKTAGAEGHGKKLKVSGINRTLFTGSFIVAAHAKIDGRTKMIGYDSVLNPWRLEGCANCQKHLVVHAAFDLVNFSLEEIENAQFSVVISHRGKELPPGFEYNCEVVQM